MAPTCKNIEIHGFADASRSAVGAVVYLRVTQANNEVQSSLVAAKTKIAPQETPKQSKRARTSRVTIPRLELVAAALLTQLVIHFKEVLSLEEAPVHLWTDSTTALHWTQRDSGRWKDYMRNRVVLIQEGLPKALWHHFPGNDEPADVSSRGCSPPQHDDVDFEERPIKVSTVQSTSIWALFEKYSSWTRLTRITAWCRRPLLVFRCNQQKKLVLQPDSPQNITSFTEKVLTPQELKDARTYWINETQLAYFRKEIQSLQDNKDVPRTSPLIHLTPVLDQKGTLQVGGRLKNSVLDWDQRQPAIIPRQSRLTQLLLDRTHRTTCHGGAQLMLATLRRNYWIIRGRVPVRSHVLKCVTCVRQRGQAAQQLMGQLPFERVTPSRVFHHTGVDYAGPFILTNWKERAAKTYKSFLIVFVCFSASAVHLELATDYSTNGFLTAFKKFTGRRGICATLTSDCGTNLVGADKELRQLFSSASKKTEQLANLLSNDGTKWLFNLPGAMVVQSHFGGKWESTVKSVKHHIKRVIGESTLTYEEFSTFLVQVEALLNSRRLSQMTEDPDDLEALTPGHFVIGSALCTPPEPSLQHIPVSRLSRWQLLRHMTEQIWLRWSREYIQQLQGICKWNITFNNIKVNAMVLLIDERYPLSKWPLARVIAVHPGPGQLVRVVTLKTATSIFKRPITKICPLPVESRSEPEEHP